MACGRIVCAQLVEVKELLTAENFPSAECSVCWQAASALCVAF